MGILSKEYICPEMDCSNIEEGKRGEICPVCGAEYKQMASFQANNLRTFKQMNKEEHSTIKEETNTIMTQNISLNEMSDEKNAEIYGIIDKLTRQEVDIDWKELEAALSSNPDAQIATACLKAIIDQNKLIIQQNELIYHELKKINDKDN